MLMIISHVVTATKKLLLYEIENISVSWAAKSLISTHLLLPSSSVVQDGVTMYAHELLTLELIWLEFNDAIKEADGDRILLSWKTIMPIFKATNHITILGKQ